MHLNRLLQILPLLTLPLLGNSCVSLSKQYPDIRLYTLEPRHPEPSAKATAEAGILAMREFTASPVCADASFTLRHEGGRVEKDYYNRFVVTPADIVQDQTAAWLRDGGTFADVRNSTTDGSAQTVLSGHLLRLEGDFATKPPAAVIAIQFALAPARNQDGTRFFRTYEERVELQSSDPEALVSGWNTAFATVLGKLEKDLSAAAGTK